MDFFAEQDRARRNLRRLIVLFLLAVFLIVVLVNVLATGFLWLVQDHNVYVGGTGWRGYVAKFTWERFFAIGAAVVVTVGFVSLVRWMQLSTGGKTVAEAMGGKRVLPQTRDRYEKRCLNIVQELSLAANMPVPALYVLPSERGINAFAAGVTPADAVVAVTRGGLLQLSRDELSGVIGHEFSHILNGDMRLGIRLAALLKGITFIGDVGHFLLRASAYGGGRRGGRNENTAALPLVGLGLLIIGWLGALSASFIKAAISRQKEYLADASAVQFTRDNRGIADALKVIGGFLPGSLVHAARAAEMGHIFFGEVRHSFWDGFATHPPLDQRIARLEPAWDGQFINRREVREVEETADTIAAGIGREALVAAALASSVLDAATSDTSSASGGDTDSSDRKIVSAAEAADQAERRDGTTGATADGDANTLRALVRDLDDPLSAMASAIGLLLAKDATQREVGIAALREHGPRGLAEAVIERLPHLEQVPRGEQFPLIARAMPALKTMSTPQYNQFKATLLAVIRADRRTDLFEWCLYQLLRHYLDPEYLRVKSSTPRHDHLSKVRGPLREVLSVLAHQGKGDSHQAFDLSVAALGLDGLSLLPLEDCSVGAFSRAVTSLADCYPLLKPRILKAMAVAAADDGEICAAERELVIAVAAVMDCPLPQDLALQI